MERTRAARPCWRGFAMNLPAYGNVGRVQQSNDARFSISSTLVAWIMIIVMSVPLDLDYSGTGGGDANPLTRALWLAVLAIGVAVALSRFSETKRLIAQIDIYFFLFIALAMASILWSINPPQTTTRIVRMFIMCSGCLTVALAGWHRRRFQQVVRLPLTLVLVGSIIFCLVRPDLAVHHELNPELFNAWHGLCLTKNALGATASFGIVFWTHAFLSKETNRFLAFGGIAVSTTCLIFSRSQTSITASIVTVLALVLLLRTPGSMRRYVPYLTSALILLILLYSLAMLKVVPGLDILLAPIPMVTGKDLTFSNRSEIWAAVVQHIQLRPLLGSGYSAYWTMGVATPDMESYAIKSQLQGFYPGSAHNGYLQILNDLGVAGLLCLLGYLYVYVRQSMRLYRVDRAQGALYLGLFLQQATINLSEPLWLNVLLIDFILMSMATMCLARSLIEVEAQTGRSAKSSPAGGTMRRPATSTIRPRARGLPGFLRPANPRPHDSATR
jgi:exopolysaccharide production protein ExoQ